MIQLKSLFAEEADYLKQIQKYAYADILQQQKKENQGREDTLESECLEVGLAGLKDGSQEIKNFGLTKSALLSYFGDYEVGSYSDGQRIVKIPFQELKGFKKPK
jgi:hypothetical protein